MDGIYLPKCDELILLENQKRGFCLISAFFQGLFDQDHTREGHLLQEIVLAMSFVIENKDKFKKMSNESLNVIGRWNSDLIRGVESGNPLKLGEFWNVEILENYISIANIQCSIFYYREIPGEEKFVLVKTRSHMSCPSKDSKCLVFVELVNKHKMLVKQMPGKQDCPTLFENTDFTVPLLYDFPITNYLASFSGDNLFLPLHLARLVVVEHFGACGYKCFSDYLGICLLYTFILLNFINYFCVCHFQDSHG